MEFISLWLLLAEAVQLTWSFQLSKLPLKLKRKKTNQPNLNSLTNTVLSLSQVSAVELAKERTCLFPQVVILTLTIWSKSEESLKQMKRTCAVKWLTSTLINRDKLPTLDVYWKEVIKPQLRKPDLTKNWQQFRLSSVKKTSKHVWMMINKIRKKKSKRIELNYVQILKRAPGRKLVCFG